MAFTGRRKARLPVVPDNASANPPGRETTERRNKDGLTWADQEKLLRVELAGTVAPDILEREIDRRYREFMLFTTTSPAAERRQRLFEEAYAATPPSQRARFVEIARKTLT